MGRPTEFVESVVTDVFVLTYNTLWSVCFLTVRPIRAAHRLHVRFRNRRRTQIAPHSLLFLLLLVTIAALAEHVRGLPLPRIFKDAVYGARAPDEFIEVAVVGLGLLFATDLLVRSTALLVHRRDPRRQERFIRLTLYVCSGQVMYMNILIVLGVLWSGL
jgi:hypothetical protein